MLEIAQNIGYGTWIWNNKGDGRKLFVEFRNKNNHRTCMHIFKNGHNPVGQSHSMEISVQFGKLFDGNEVREKPQRTQFPRRHELNFGKYANATGSSIPI